MTRWEPLFVVGDVNIRLDRPDDFHNQHLLEVLSAHGLHCRVMSPNHDRGGILDILRLEPTLLRLTSVCWRPASLTIGCCVGTVTLNDHVYRPWHRVNVDEFKAALRESALSVDSATDADRACDDDTDVDVLVDQYSTVITSIADRLAPCVRPVVRPDECRAARKKRRWFERRSTRSSAYTERSELGCYQRLTCRKRRYCMHPLKIKVHHDDDLGRFIDQLMGWEKHAASPDTSASDVPFFLLLTSKNVVTLKSGSEFTPGH